MQKVMTGYTMYFNKRYKRTGPLFAGVFKSRHITHDPYLKHVVSYIHLNPAELFDSRWKLGSAVTQKIKNGLYTYPYSSLFEHALDSVRPEKEILSPVIFDL